jgi:hypothetical protein
MTDNSRWILEVGTVEKADTFNLRTPDELKSLLGELEQRESGELCGFQDYGKRVLPWWQRLLGCSDWYCVQCFTLLWHTDYATLMFHDESLSEYHAVTTLTPGVEIPVEIRIRLNFDEPTPAPLQECLQKSRAFAAVFEFIDAGARPKWLSYRHVR